MVKEGHTQKRWIEGSGSDIYQNDDEFLEDYEDDDSYGEFDIYYGQYLFGYSGDNHKETKHNFSVCKINKNCI